MAGSVVRRPLPALIALVALLLLTAIVWWRVLHRDHGTPTAKTCSTPTPSVSPTGSALPPPSTITVQVVNSTKRNGIAAAVRATLIKDGFRVPTAAANDPSPARAKNLGVAQLRYSPAGATAATHLRFYFPGAALVHTTGASPVVVVAIGNAYKAVATPAAVTAAMKAARTSVAPATPSPTPTASC